MRRRNKGAAVAAALVASTFASNAFALSNGCNNLRGFGTQPIGTAYGITADWTQGEVITVTTTTQAVTLSGAASGTIAAGQTGTVTIPATVASTNLLFSEAAGSTITITCAAGSASPTPSPASTPASTIVSQTVNNAQAALMNGGQTLQSYNDWVSKGVMGS